MENLNAEQIKKVLEHCTNWTFETGCKGCPYEDNCIDEDVTRDALALITSQEQRIKELTEEKEVAIDDLERCMYYAKPKRANTCNFCIHDCEISQDGTQCKGKEDWIYCSPVWRGVVKSKLEGE